MRTLLTHLTLLALTVLMSSAVAAQARLDVTVKNIREPKGTLRIGLFANEEDFLKKIAEGKVVKATGKEVTVSFENLKPGDYAVSVIHDENENGELDTNIIGIPKEGFAFGNNAMGTFGPPAFEKAKMTLKAGVSSQVINLKYF